MEKRNVPEIQFEGFTDDWEQYKMGDIVDVCSGRDYKHLSEGDIPVYGTGGYMLSVNKALSYDRDAVGIGRKGTIDKPYILRAPFWTVDTLFYVLPRDYENIDFTFDIFQTIDWRKKDESTGVPSLSKEAINEIEIMIPSSEEQKKIGAYFKQFDYLITFHQRKYEKLKLFKEAMLDKMFPKNGQKVPEIRFKGFTDDWEEHKFSDITFLAGEKNKNNLRYESYSISNEKGFVPQNEQFENGGTMKDANKRMYYIVKPNSFAYNPARINIGSIGYSNLSKKVIVSSLYEVFQTVEDVDDRFLWHWFKTNTFQKMIEQLQEGGVRLYFYYDKLCMGTIMMPVLSEQKKIGEYLDNLDNLITLHQRKYEKLKLFKEAMLNKMFI